MTSVLETVEDRASRHPEKLLYSFLDVNGREIASHTYRSFLQRVDLIASHLTTRQRSRAGDRVLLVYPPGLEMVCALFACTRVGLIPVPTAAPAVHGFSSTLSRMSHIACDCQPALLLTTQDTALKIADIGVRCSSAEGLRMAGRALTALESLATDGLDEAAGPAPRTNPSEVFLLQYTSGSTCTPKGVVVTHDNVIHNCRMVVDHDDPVAVSWLPQHHDMGLLGYYIYVAMSGGTTYGFSPTSFIQRPSLWLEAITRVGATGSSAPNFAFEYCLRPGRLPENTLSTLNLSSLRVLMAAAEPVKPETFRRFLQKLEPYGLRPESFFAAYGLAENTLAVTSYGRRVLSVNKHKIGHGIAAEIRDVSEVGEAKHLISCGRPLTGNIVRIVNPVERLALPQGGIGEVWVGGGSKCLGYWNKPALTAELFKAQIAGEDGEYLRTGDLGFLQDDELYVCGRLKDLIIVRGQNFYPQDIESIVENSSPQIRRGCVAAFETDRNGEPSATVVAELTNRTATLDATSIAEAIRAELNLEVGAITLVPPKTLPKTSSGKMMRHKAREMWLAGEFDPVSSLVIEKRADVVDSERPEASPCTPLRARYGLTGSEDCSLIEAGVDSLDLVTFVHGVKELYRVRGGSLETDEFDFQLVHRFSVAALFELVERLVRAKPGEVVGFQHLLTAFRSRHLAEVRATMQRDRWLAFTPAVSRMVASPERPRTVLLTGATGFLGPFLTKSLLEQTDAQILALTRGATASEAKERLRSALERAAGSGSAALEEFDRRVIPILGDLEKPSVGVSPDEWRCLAREADVIYHNGAAVNYLLDYSTLRRANVCGTNELVRLAFDGKLKPFHYISTTFIFGWATKAVLDETDRNDGMDLLDFGYSQSKWVAEQVVLDAIRQGLPARIFRPALITPSVHGCGDNFDITIRLLAFMIKHGIGVDALNQVSFVPADVAANNIVAIANLREAGSDTFHLTRDRYSNMVEITDIISARTGRRFELFSLRDFVPEVIRRCTKEDLLFPLLDFLVRSVDNISAMEFKRYDSSSYQRARSASAWGTPDPSLEDTVGGILKFMARTGIL